MQKFFILALTASTLVACGPSQGTSQALSTLPSLDIDYRLSDPPKPLQGDTGSCYIWALQAVLVHRQADERAAANRIDFGSTFYYDWWEMQDASVDKALDLEVLNFKAMQKHAMTDDFKKLTSDEERKSDLTWGVFETRPGLLGGLLLGQDNQSSTAFESMRQRLVLKTDKFVSDQQVLSELYEITARFVDARWKIFQTATTSSDAAIKKEMKPLVEELAQKIASLQEVHKSDSLPAALEKIKFNRIDTKNMSLEERRQVFLSKLKENGALTVQQENHLFVVVGYSSSTDAFEVRDSTSEDTYYQMKGDELFASLVGFDYLTR